MRGPETHGAWSAERGNGTASQGNPDPQCSPEFYAALKSFEKIEDSGPTSTHRCNRASWSFSTTPVLH